MGAVDDTSAQFQEPISPPVSPSTASTSESSGDNISSSLTGVIKKAMKAGVNSDDDEFVEPPQSTDTLGTSEKAEADKMLTEVRSMNISPSNDSSRDSVSEQFVTT